MVVNQLDVRYGKEHVKSKVVDLTLTSPYWMEISQN